MDSRRRIQPPPGPTDRRPPATGGSSAGRAAAGALRISNTISAAISGHRELAPVEARIMIAAATVLLAIGLLAAVVPRMLAYPVAAIAMWLGGALLYRGYRLFRRAKRKPDDNRA